MAQPGITSTIIGANTLEQLQQNLGSLNIDLQPNQMEELNSASALEDNPYLFFSEAIQKGIFGGQTVKGWR